MKVKAILVAGGHGSRLYPFTNITQKTLLPIYNRPVIDYALGTIRRAGITNITIISNQFIGQIAKHVGSGLEALKSDGLLTEVRGVGAIWAGQITGATTEQGLQVRDRMTELGVICRAINGALAFCPPLIIENNDIDLMVDTASTAINEIIRP